MAEEDEKSIYQKLLESMRIDEFNPDTLFSHQLVNNWRFNTEDNGQHFTINYNGSEQEDVKKDMNNYMFLNLNQTVLREHEIPFAELDGGIIIEEDYLDMIHKLDGGITYHTKPSDYEGVIIMEVAEETEISLKELKEEPTRRRTRKAKLGKVKTVSWDGPRNLRKPFRDIVSKILVPVIKQDVDIHVPHGYITTPYKNEKFNILIWSSPKATHDGCNTPHKLWGIDVGCRQSDFKASGLGIPIIDESSGWCVGELVENNLYIHHDICHYGSEEEQKLFARICEEAAKELGMSPKERAKRVKELEKQLLKNARKLYIKKCANRVEQEKQRISESVTSIKSTIAEQQKRLIDKIRELKQDTLRLKQLNSLDTTDTTRYKKEYDKLVSLPKVTKVLVIGNTVEVYTNVLFCKDKDNLYEIGAFKIVISDDHIRCYNQTRIIDYGDGEFHAPHIGEGGEACWGNTAEIWPDLLANYEYATIAMIVIQFIESVNAADEWGCMISEWPLVKTKVKAKPRVKKGEK